MGTTNYTNVNFRSLKVAGAPYGGSPAAIAAASKFDNLTASGAIAIGGNVVSGTAVPGAPFTNFGDVEVASLGGGGVVPTLRLVPQSANAFVLMASSDRGTAFGHSFIRNVGGAAGGLDAGPPYQPWRYAGTAEYASLASVPGTDAPIFVYANDTGSFHYALQRTGQTAFMGGYHGGETLTAAAMTMDGVAIDGLSAVSGNAFSYKYSATITDGIATMTVTDAEYTNVPVNGGIKTTIASLSSAQVYTKAYIGMFIANADVWDEVGFKLTTGTQEIMAPLGYLAPYGETDLQLANDTRVRSSATGRSARLASNIAAIAGYRRTTVIRDGARAKAYYDFGNAGAFGTKTGFSWTMTFEVGAAGATNFGSSLVTNGTFDTVLTPWTSSVSTGGSITANAAKARMSRGTANDNRLFQGFAATPGAVYFLSAEVTNSALAGQPGIGITSASNGSTSTPTPIAPITQYPSSSPLGGGYQAKIGVANLTTHYAMLTQFSTAAGGAQGDTSDFDNARVFQLAAGI